MKKIIFLFLFLLCFIFSYAQKGAGDGDSLIRSLKDSKDDTNKVSLLIEIADFYNKTNADKALDYSDQALSLSNKLKWQKGEADAYSMKGYAYQLKGDLTKSLDMQLTALKIFEQINKTSGIFRSTENIGMVYCMLKRLDKGTEYLNAAYEIARKSGVRAYIAMAAGNMGNLYMRTGNFDKALECEDTALSIHQALGHVQQTAIYLGNIGSIYSEKKEYAKALAYEFKALEIERQVGDKDGVALNLGNIGAAYLNIVSDSHYKIVSDSLVSADRQANLLKAKTYLLEAETEIRAVGDLNTLCDILQNLSKVQELLHEPEKALATYKTFFALRDSIDIMANEQKIAELQVKYDFDKKAAVATAIQNRKNILSVTIICVVILIAVFIGIAYYKSRKTNDLLSQQRKIIAEQVKDLAAVSKMREKFMANVSHELRTPATLLTGMLELVKNKQSTGSKDREQLEIAYNNSKKLKFMVEEILDLSKLEHNLIQANLKAVPAQHILRKVLAPFRIYIENKGMRFEYNDDGVNGANIYIDENKFDKIISNLLYNAVKFNKNEGWVKVNATLSLDKKLVVITVSDSGEGIAAVDLPHIFDRFYQASGAANMALGSGIGLAIVKEFSQLLGGSVSVSSEVGKGSTFTLQFPVTDGKVEDLSLTEESERTGELQWELFKKKQHVLLVDDNSEMRYYLKEILDGKVEISEVENGKQALEWLSANKTDLIITDVMMPEMDGHELVKRLKASGIFQNIPIISLTAFADFKIQSDLLRLGVAEFMVKPFSAVELNVRVYNLLSINAERHQYIVAPEQPEEDSIDQEHADEFILKIKEYVVANIKDDITIKDLAGSLALSERQLYRLAKSLTGFTPAQLIKEVRLQKAYEYLLMGDVYKIDDISRRVGFDKSSYFAQQFYERFGKRVQEFYNQS